MTIITAAGRLGGSYLLKKFFEFGKDKFTSQFGTSALDSILMLDDNTINQEFELYKNETKDDEKETLPATTQEGEFKDPEQEPPKDPNIAPEILAEGALEVTEKLSKQGDVKEQTKKALDLYKEGGRIESVDDQGYYSRVVKTVTDTNQDKMPKEQWANIIKNSKLGVDKNEYNYLKLDTFLQGKDSIDKKELLDFIELNNVAPYIKVESNTYAEAAPQGYDDLYLDYTVNPSFGKHEFITFQVDKDFYNGDIVFQSEHSDRYGANNFAHARTQVGIGDSSAPPAEFTKEAVEKLENTLLINEIQSDWLQLLRRKGPVEQFNIEDRGDSFVVIKDGKIVQRFDRFDQPPSIEAVQDMLVRAGDAAPSFPISDSKKWVEFVLNQMIKKATADGLDSIAVTNGQIQINHYEGQAREDSEGLKYFYDSIVTPQLKKIAKKYGAEIEEIVVTNDDTGIARMSSKIKDALRDNYVLKQINGEIISDAIFSLDNKERAIPDFASIYGATGNGTGVDGLLNVLDTDSVGSMRFEEDTNQVTNERNYYVWVLDNSTLANAIDRGDNETIIKTFDSLENTEAGQKSAIAFNMPIALVQEGATNVTNYNSFLLDRLSQIRKGMQESPTSEKVIKMKLPEKLKQDIIDKPIKLTQLEKQTNRLLA
tara:strand:+ start:86 stop:2047 length:1962 start_codon:yes stop_codon:yes gene_type:complete